MHHSPARVVLTFALACGLALPTGACITDPDPGDPDELGTAEAALISPNGATQSAPQQGMGAIGYRRNGVVEVKCTGAFLRNDWLLTETRCIEALPWGSQLVATSGFDLSRPASLTPTVAGAQWVTVAARSALASNPDLALVRLSQNLSTGRAGDVNATSGFVRPVATAPLTVGTMLNCFGFSVDATGVLRLGFKPLTIMNPALSMQVPAGFDIQAERTDHGGACFGGGALRATVRFVDLGTLELFDVARRWLVPAEIAALIAGSPLAAGRPWPITQSPAGTTRCMTMRAGGDNLHTEPCAPIWSQGFAQLLIASTVNTDDVQFAHRGTGLCVEAAAFGTGFSMQACAAAGTAARWRQTVRVFYLADGSVQLLVPSTGFCMTELDWGSAGTVVWSASCNNGQRWVQGLGRN